MSGRAARRRQARGERARAIIARRTDYQDELARIGRQLGGRAKLLHEDELTDAQRVVAGVQASAVSALAGIAARAEYREKVGVTLDPAAPEAHNDALLEAYALTMALSNEFRRRWPQEVLEYIGRQSFAAIADGADR